MFHLETIPSLVQTSNHPACSDYTAMAGNYPIKMPLDYPHHRLRKAFSIIRPSAYHKRRFCHVMLCVEFKTLRWKFAERPGCECCSVAGNLNSKLASTIAFLSRGREQVCGFGDCGDIRNGTRRRTRGRHVNLSCSWSPVTRSLLLEIFDPENYCARTFFDTGYDVEMVLYVIRGNVFDVS